MKVSIKMKDNGLPLHENAELKVRPRIFFEGNLFIDVRPGTPDSPEVEDGHTFPASQTAAPVQIDQVLGTLKTDTRKDLQDLLIGYGDSLGGEPQPGEDDDQDPSTEGQTAGESLNDSLQYSADALRGQAIVNQAILGTELHDLSKLLAGQQKVTAALASNETQLKDLITNFNITMAALASESDNLRETVRLPARPRGREPGPRQPERCLPVHARVGARDDPRRTRDARHHRGRVPVDPPDERAALARRAAGARRRPEPCSRLHALQRRTAEAAPRPRRLQPLPVRGGAAHRRADHRGRQSQHRPAELPGVLADDGQALRESQNFDGSGNYVRFQAGGGGRPVRRGWAAPGRDANATAAPLGTRPREHRRLRTAELRLPSQSARRPERRPDRGGP